MAQVILQPLFLLFVFGKVLSALGYTRGGYADLLFPGLLALTAMIRAIQALAFPLMVEFGWTMDLEDRLLAPMATGLLIVHIHTAVVHRLCPVPVAIAGSTRVVSGRHRSEPYD